MKKSIGDVVFRLCLIVSIGIACIQNAYPAAEPVVTNWPLQLSTRVPFEPTAGAPIELSRIDVVDHARHRRRQRIMKNERNQVAASSGAK